MRCILLHLKWKRNYDDVTETDKDLDIKVTIENIYSKNQKIISADMIILATGYKQYFPK